jgi:hypothetical protein
LVSLSPLFLSHSTPLPALPHADASLRLELRADSGSMDASGLTPSPPPYLSGGGLEPSSNAGGTQQAWKSSCVEAGAELHRRPSSGWPWLRPSSLLRRDWGDAPSLLALGQRIDYASPVWCERWRAATSGRLSILLRSGPPLLFLR